MAFGNVEGSSRIMDPDFTARDSAAPSSANGFRARLEGLSLFDLVQMECLARARRVVRVVSAGRVGYLYFKDGEIFHATTKTRTGERAAIEMLGWTDGTFEPCTIAWPERPSVSMGWQNLLLGAATTNDEHAAGKLVQFTPRRPASVPPPPVEDVTDAAEELHTTQEGSQVKSISDVQSASPFKRSVHVDASGSVITGTGDVEDLAGFAAYASRVGCLIGESLGLGEMEAMELTFESSRAIIRVEDGGMILAVEARSADDLAALAKSAGL